VQSSDEASQQAHQPWSRLVCVPIATSLLLLLLAQSLNEAGSDANELHPTDKEHHVMRGLVSCLPILEALNLNLGQRCASMTLCVRVCIHAAPQGAWAHAQESTLAVTH